MKNYYDILGLETNASFDEIKLAYKTLVKKFHPDVNPQQRDFFENKSKSINEAYEILSNPNKRNNYDLRLKEFLNRQYNNQPNSNYSEQKEQDLKRREDELKRKQHEFDERQNRRENDFTKQEEVKEQEVDKSKEGKNNFILIPYLLLTFSCLLLLIAFGNSLNNNNKSTLINNIDSIKTVSTNENEKDSSNIDLKENIENKVKSNFVTNEKSHQTNADRKKTVLNTTFNTIKTKGLYQSNKINDFYYDYLKFYNDSTVIAVSSAHDSKRVKNWFNREDESIFIGTYSIKNDSIFFECKWRNMVKYIYRGKIHSKEISIFCHRSDGYKFTQTYKYVK